MHLEDYDARLGHSISSMETPIGLEEGGHDVNEAGSFTEAFSSDEGSIGDDEDVGINQSVLRRKTSPCRNLGHPASPGATFKQPTMFG